MEFHGFKDNNNRFIVKELAVVGKYFQSQVIFQPPYCFNNLNSKMRRTARWLSRHYHNMRWDDSGAPYDEQIIRDLCKPFKTLYTKGLEKVEFLREFHDDVREITWTCPEPSEVICLLPTHRGCDTKCALRNAVSFQQYLNRTAGIFPFINDGDRVADTISGAESA